ncbi:MAG: penicillin-binding protein [Oscillospiraceae bacterium]|jgi:penicillin-binding protein 1A|nr:penicillin-binding protein [Oscillospiraceae bacterium]
MSKKKNEKGRGKGRKIGRGIFMSILTFVLTGFLTATIVGGYFFLNANAVVSGEAVIDLEEYKANQSLTTIIYAIDKDGNEIEYARLHGEENRIWMDLDEIPRDLQDAYIALEDKRFHEHKGVDWVRFGAVLTKYSFTQGASTLTQQLIKNLTGEKDVTAIRKYNEILTALNVEKNYSKDTIIEAYLNTLYLGRGCYGVKTGAEKYFGKEVGDLNLAECASLAAITKAPNQFDPLVNTDKNKERQLECLYQMHTQGLITTAEYEEAKAYKMIFTNSEDYVPKKETTVVAQPQAINNYYVDFIIDTLIQDLKEQKGMSAAEALHEVYYGGLKIYAAVDVDIQKELEDVYRNRVTFSNFKATEKQPAPQSSMTIMDYKGRVVAIAGGAGEKTGNRSLNRAAQSWRQPGSTIKPLSVYGPAIEKDLITWSTLTLNQSFEYAGQMWPQNADGTHGTGARVTTQYALARSLNTVSARTLNEKLKIGSSFEFLRDNFGFTKLDKVNDQVLPSLAVGGMTNGFTTLEECAAYAVFGNGGTYYSPYCYYKVTNNKGNEMVLDIKNTQTVKRAFSEGTAKVMNEMLGTVGISSYSAGDNNKYIKKFDYFAKTGTTSDNKDRWFAAGTPYYVASVWFGYDMPKNLGNIENPAARIWTEVFNRIHKNLDTKKKFPTTSEAVKKSYCTRTGDIASANCPETATGWYKTSNLPKTCSTCGAVVITVPKSSSDENTGGIAGWLGGLFE